MAFKMKGPSLYSSPLSHKTGVPHCHPDTNPDGSPSCEGKKDMKRRPKKKKNGKN